MFLLFTDEAQTNKALKSLLSVWTNNWYKTYFFFKGMGRWFQKTTVGKTTLSNLWLRHWSVGEAQPVITAAESDTGLSPAGHSSVSLGGRTIPLVLGEAWPLHFGMGWAHNTNATGAPQPAPCGTKEVGRIRRVDPAWGGTTPQRKPEKELQKKKKRKKKSAL